jgi:iron-sulfur cluster assembly protein
MPLACSITLAADKGIYPMFGIPGKAAVTLTPSAAKQISRLMQRDGRAGLRIGVKKGGCAGMEYTMDYVAEANPLDEVVEQDGARVLIAPLAQMFLIGTQIDY